jgi:hypothetical protein
MGRNPASNCTVHALIQKGYLASHPCEQWNSHAGEAHNDAIGHPTRQVIAMRPANGKILVLNHDGNPIYGILGGSRIDLDDTPSAQKTMRRLSECGRAAPLRIITALLAAAWVGTPGLSEARPAQPDALVSAAQNVDFGGATGNDGSQTAQVSRRDDKSLQVAQATPGDPGHPPEPEHHWAETLLDELTIARRDIELLQRLAQEHDRAELLEQALAAARRDVETQTALAEKAREQASRMQVGESGTAEVQTSLQQERERSARLEQDIAPARREVVETQTALAKASEEASRLKQASESSEAELQKSL